MRVVGRKCGRCIATCNVEHLGNAHIAKDAVMVAMPFAAKPAKEQEHIARTDAMFGEMRLRRAMLPKGDMSAIAEKRIMVTPRRAIAHMIGKADVAIARAAHVIGAARRDRQADRATIDNR